MSLLTNLIGFWEHEEGTGSGDRIDAHGTNDLTPTDNTGTPVSMTQGAGKVGNASEFSGSNELRHTDNADLSVGDIDWTRVFWFFIPTTPSAITHGLVSKFNEATFEGEYQVVYDSVFGAGNEFVKFAWGPLTGVINIFSPPAQNGTFTKNAWHFVAIRHDSVNNLIRLRVDTTVETAVATGGHFPSDETGRFRVGSNGSAQAGSGLRVDQDGFWKRHLSDAELDELYNSGNGLSYVQLAGSGTISPSGIVSTASVGSHVLSGAATISPSSIVSTSNIGSHTLSGAATISPSSVSPTAIIGEPVLTGANTLSPTGVNSATVIGSHALSGAFTISPNGIDSTSTIGSHTLTGAATISPNGVGSTIGIGEPVLTSIIAINPTGVASTVSIGSHTITPGGVTIGPSGISSTALIGSHSLTGASSISPSGVNSGVVVGSHIVGGVSTLNPSGISSTVSVGTPILTDSNTINPLGVVSTVSIGTPIITVGVMPETPDCLYDWNIDQVVLESSEIIPEGITLASSGNHDWN